MRAPQPSSTSSQSPQEGWPANRSPSGCPSRELGAVDGSTAALLASIAFDFNPGEAEIRGPSVSEGSRLFVKVSPPRRTHSLGWGPHCPRPPLPPRRHAPGEAVFLLRRRAWHGAWEPRLQTAPQEPKRPHTPGLTDARDNTLHGRQTVRAVSPNWSARHRLRHSPRPRPTRPWTDTRQPHI